MSSSMRSHALEEAEGSDAASKFAKQTRKMKNVTAAEYPDGLEPDWTIYKSPRKMCSKIDKFYKPPGEYKLLRSMREVREHIAAQALLMLAAQDGDRK